MANQDSINNFKCQFMIGCTTNISEIFHYKSATESVCSLIEMERSLGRYYFIQMLTAKEHAGCVSDFSVLVRAGPAF